MGEAQWKKLEEVKVTVMQGSRGQSLIDSWHSLMVTFVALSTRMVNVALLPIGIVLSGLYLYWGGKSTLVGNVLAVSFAHNAISMVKLDSVRTGAILLIGLFVYDVWWVFGTEVASSVVLECWTRMTICKIDGESSDDVGCADQTGVAAGWDDVGTGRRGYPRTVCCSGRARGAAECAWAGGWICGRTGGSDGGGECDWESAARAAVCEVRTNLRLVRARI